MVINKFILLSYSIIDCDDNKCDGEDWQGADNTTFDYNFSEYKANIYT